ncbi:MAG: hypothetical protein JWQ78_1291 [Sediminibacterium sp.]|nr:hypothetical protein [Sediminibacterium sp.]
MKIPSILGIVSYKVFPAQMGGQQSVAGFYHHLGAKTKLVLAVARGNEIPRGVPYKVLPFLYNHWQGSANLRFIYRLVKLIREERIDVIVIEHSYFGWLGVLLRRLTGKPFVIRSHNIEAHRFRDLRRSWWRAYGGYEKKVHQQADHNFFITPEDKAWAISHWQLEEKKCTVVTHGTDLLQPPPAEEKKRCRQQLLSEHNLLPDTRLFLFNGSLDYLPNIDALRILTSEIIPILQSQSFTYRIFICGKGLHPQWQQVLEGFPQILYKGFVADIRVYFTGVDCFINPVTLGGGIKIKLVEAIAHNLSVISTRSGARGIGESLAEGKLTRVADYDWPAFARAMVAVNIQEQPETPEAFYREFNWNTIVQEALLSLQTL